MKLARSKKPLQYVSSAGHHMLHFITNFQPRNIFVKTNIDIFSDGTVCVKSFSLKANGLAKW